MLMTSTLRVLAAAAIALALDPAVAHAVQQAPAPVAAGSQPLRVFLDCDACDFDFVRTETPWVDYVRDRTVSDVHVLVTQIGTGAGGTEYTVNLVGQGRFAARNDTVAFSSVPGMTSAERRSGLTRTIQLGLVPFAVRTPQGAALRVTFEDDEDAVPTTSPADDPWRAWVFEIGANGSFEREQRQREVQVEGELQARRVTALWKIGIESEGRFERDRFDVDDRSITARNESYEAGAVAIRSLGGHWGTGAQVVVSSSTFNNLDLAARVAGAVEYSFFPYDEATRRQFVVQYSLGVSSFQYREVTIFDRLEETRPTQALVLGYDLDQPWGSANVEVETASFLDELQKYRVEFDANLDFRVLRGLSLRVGGNASLIRDQLNIVKRDATPEEVLLQQRALQTDYRYSAYVGINYTFGSIFNSVVNPRVGGGPGQILR